jgi:hypothetical protein
MTRVSVVAPLCVVSVVMCAFGFQNPSSVRTARRDLEALLGLNVKETQTSNFIFSLITRNRACFTKTRARTTPKTRAIRTNLDRFVSRRD